MSVLWSVWKLYGGNFRVLGRAAQRIHRFCCAQTGGKKFGTPELSGTEAQRYSRVLGQLAWAALSRADLAFHVGFFSRFQSKPHVPAEICLRSFLRWLKGHLHFAQQMPASSPPALTEEGVVVGFCDASWNVTSVSGAVISWRGCCLKCFRRRQEVPRVVVWRSRSDCHHGG